MNAWELYKQEREKRKQEEAKNFNGKAAWDEYKASRAAKVEKEAEVEKAEEKPSAAPTKPLLPKGKSDHQMVALKDPEDKTKTSPFMMEGERETERNYSFLDPFSLLGGNGALDPTSLLRGEMTIPGAQAEHWMATNRANQAEETLDNLRSAQNAANTAANPFAAEQIAKGAGYSSLADLNAAVSLEEDNLRNANASVDKSAQTYYDLTGRQAVSDLRNGTDKDTFYMLLSIAEQMQGIESDKKYGGWDNSDTNKYTSLSNAKEQYISQLMAKGFDRATIERAMEYEAEVRAAQKANASAQETYEWADKHPVAGALTSILTSPAQGLDYLSAALGNIGHNSTKDLDSYRPLNESDFTITGQTQALREGASADMGNVGKFLFNTGMSMADSALLVATLGPGATVVMGMGAASNTAKDVVERGGTNNQALLAGLAAGVAEGFFEKFSVDNLISMSGGKGAKDFILNVLKQSGIEATEEINTELTNILLDTAIMGSNSNFNTAVQEYMAQGMTEEEAKKSAFMDNLKQVALSGLAGAVSGGGMAAVNLGTQNAMDKLLEGKPVREGAYLLQNAANLQNSQQETPVEAPATEQPTRLTNSQVEKMIRDPEVMKEMGIDTNGKTMRQLREEVRTTLDRQNNAESVSAKESVVTAPQESVPESEAQGQDLIDEAEHVAVDSAEQSVYNGTTTEGNTNEEVHLRDSGQRNGSAHSGGQVSAVEEGAGRAESRQESSRAADRGTASLSYGERVSTASLGIGGGSIQNTIRVVKGGETQHTAEAKRLAQERGLRVTFFADGDLSIRQADRSMADARGYISGDRVFIRVDHPRYTADQIMRHEIGHDKIAKGEIDVKDVKKRIIKAVGRGQTRKVSKAYADAYAGSGLTAVDIWELILCESVGEMIIF